MVQVTNPTPLFEGKAEQVQSPAPGRLPPAFAATGDMTRMQAFWSQAPASQFAASAAGNVPPITNPK